MYFGGMLLQNIIVRVIEGDEISVMPRRGFSKNWSSGKASIVQFIRRTKRQTILNSYKNAMSHLDKTHKIYKKYRHTVSFRYVERIKLPKKKNIPVNILAFVVKSFFLVSLLLFWFLSLVLWEYKLKRFSSR
jgi:hypothetical protein